MKKITQFVLNRFNLASWWGIAFATWAVSRVTQVWLDGFYARSKFPVPFYTGQTTFNAAELKGYYASMVEQGTLDIYVQTQLVDFVFMAASYLFLLALAGAALRSLPKALLGTRLFSLGKALLWIIPLAPVFDAFENLTSFVMLADPAGFADWLVYPYSAFAVVKFALFAVGYLWAITCIAIGVVYGCVCGVKRLSRTRIEG